MIAMENLLLVVEERKQIGGDVESALLCQEERERAVLLL
jgi:hypothetical protein